MNDLTRGERLQIMLTTDELDAFCLASDALARFKRPREYRFVESLPKSPSGKILRRLLREEAPAA